MKFGCYHVSFLSRVPQEYSRVGSVLQCSRFFVKDEVESVHTLSNINLGKRRA